MKSCGGSTAWAFTSSSRNRGQKHWPFTRIFMLWATRRAGKGAGRSGSSICTRYTCMHVDEDTLMHTVSFSCTRLLCPSFLQLDTHTHALSLVHTWPHTYMETHTHTHTRWSACWCRCRQAHVQARLLLSASLIGVPYSRKADSLFEVISSSFSSIDRDVLNAPSDPCSRIHTLIRTDTNAGAG